MTQQQLKQAPESVAVIGAGMAGLTCATSLMLNIPQVRVFERGLHAGGRMSSYRARGYEFDAGTQYFTVHDELLRESLSGWLSEGVVQEWQGWVVELDRGNFMCRDTIQRYVGTPTMAAIGRHLAELCEVSFGVQVSRLVREDGGIRLVDRLGDDLGRFDLVVLATPPAIAARLAAGVAPALAEAAAQVQMTKCWSVMLGFEQPLPLPYDAAYVFNSSLNWIARNSSKPRRAEREAWVLHATPEWTEAHTDLTHEQVIQEMIKAFEKATGSPLPERPRLRVVRYWEQAAPIDGLDTAFLLDADAGLGMCGDWCVAPRLEGAFRSGWSMANHVLDSV